MDKLLFLNTDWIVFSNLLNLIIGIVITLIYYLLKKFPEYVEQNLGNYRSDELRALVEFMQVIKAILTDFVHSAIWMDAILVILNFCYLLVEPQDGTGWLVAGLQIVMLGTNVAMRDSLEELQF